MAACNITSLIAPIIFLVILTSYTCTAQKQQGILRLVYLSATDQYGYVDSRQDTIIPMGKYPMCFTEKFDKLAIVSNSENIVGIDRKENILFNVFVFDNGPDDISEGLFRIVKDGKIGYADRNGIIVIPPIYDCAYPFKSRRARVGKGCKLEYSGEHNSWLGGDWQTIDRKGNVVRK